MEDYLIHHGVKGMHWGVRRYQNPDGTLTTLGKERQVYVNRAKRSAKTKKDIDQLYNTLSDKDKELLGDDKHNKEWLSIEEGEYVVKRLIKKIGKIPVAALDVMTTTKNGHLAVSIMTDPKHRGKGYAKELVSKGIEWYNKNKKRINATTLDWGAYQSNIPSKRLAENAGFKYNKNKSSKNWAVYNYN